MVFSFTIVAIVFISFYIKKLLLKYINQKVVNVFLLPGTIVKELSLAISCIVTGTTIKKFNIISIENSEIRYSNPKIPILFNFLISSAPIFGCSFAIIFVSVIFENPIKIKESLPDEISFSLNSIVDYVKNYLDVVFLSFNDFWKHGFSNLRSILCIIFSIIFSISIAPKEYDIKFIAPGFLIIASALFVLEKVGISVLKYNWWQNALNSSWIIVTYVISVLLAILVVLFLIIGFVRGIKLLFG